MNHRLLIVLILLALILIENQPIARKGGEILWQEGPLTLYRCGPGHGDVCLNDGYRVTKVYVGE